MTWTTVVAQRWADCRGEGCGGRRWCEGINGNGKESYSSVIQATPSGLPIATSD